MMSDKNTALLVIDMQEALFAAAPFQAALLRRTVAQLLAAARAASLPLALVQHEDGSGELVRGSAGWQLIEECRPQAGEALFAKHHNSAFKETGLREWLAAGGIERLVVVGMQTEYCIETTVRVAYEYGFEIWLPEEGNSTLPGRELSAEALWRHHNRDIMQGRFARHMSAAEIIRYWQDAYRPKCC